MRDLFGIFLSDLKNSIYDLLPIIIVVALFQVFIIHSIPDNLFTTSLGLKALKNEIDFSSKNEFNIAFTLPISHIIGLDIEEIQMFEKEIQETIKRI